ncbi:MAG: AMP-binding protein [Oligoflexales bacterium]|nr:AMP-binding protein [Oligoflexales bacterium]
MTLIHLIEIQAEKYPLKRALIAPVGRDSRQRRSYAHLTFCQLLERTEALGSRLEALGVKQGMKALVFLRPSLDWPAIILALMRLGVIPVFIDPGMGFKNLFSAISKMAPELVICEPVVRWARFCVPWVFKSVKVWVTSSDTGFWSSQRDGDVQTKQTALELKAGDEAAIMFTSGGTGAPKGVLYTHGMFTTQAELVRDMFALDEKTIDMSAFPLFSLYTMAFGGTSILPDMDIRRPAAAAPSRLYEQIVDQGISMISGSPAVWRRLASYCTEKKITLPSLTKVLLFGAPVSLDLHRLFQPLIPNGDTYTPYGATECLPVSCISGRDILGRYSQKMERGEGTPLGAPFPRTEISIESLSLSKEGVPPSLEISPLSSLPSFSVGEIVVKGAQASPRYQQEEKATQAAKIYEKDFFWHRMGDLGYLDEEGVLWFCGRKVHRVETHLGPLDSIPCESIFNQHPDVARSALIGLTLPHTDKREPCIVIERKDRRTELSKQERLHFKQDLLSLAQKVDRTKDLKTFFLHPAFPVDLRHNIKIDRLALARYFEAKRDSHLG